MSNVAELRELGGRWFAQGNFAEAREAYQNAVDAAACLVRGGSSTDPSVVAALFSNLSACNMQLEEYDKAVMDAHCAVKLAPKWAKGHYRLACALRKIPDEKRAALDVIERGLVFEPDNKEMRLRLAEWRQEDEEERIRADAEARPCVLVRSDGSVANVQVPPSSCGGGEAVRSPLLESVGLDMFRLYKIPPRPSANHQMPTGCRNDFATLFAALRWCDRAPSPVEGDVVVVRDDGSNLPVSIGEVLALHDFLKTTREQLAENRTLQVSRHTLAEWQVSYNLLAVQLAASDPRVGPVSFIDVPDAEAEDGVQDEGE